jgi:hypothetical protein
MPEAVRAYAQPDVNPRTINIQAWLTASANLLPPRRLAVEEPAADALARRTSAAGFCRHGQASWLLLASAAAF